MTGKKTPFLPANLTAKKLSKLPNQKSSFKPSYFSGNFTSKLSPSIKRCVKSCILSSVKSSMKSDIGLKKINQNLKVIYTDTAVKQTYNQNN